MSYSSTLSVTYCFRSLMSTTLEFLSLPVRLGEERVNRKGHYSYFYETVNVSLKGYWRVSPKCCRGVVCDYCTRYNENRVREGTPSTGRSGRKIFCKLS